jgi:hypothetical protein
MPQARKKQPKKAASRMRTRLILPGEEMPELDEDAEDDAGGMFLEKEDVRLICHALRNYKPAENEVALQSALLEEFEEILVVDYDEIPPEVN